ncbi:hypothetical protein VA596_48365 [Amycolatopsis sp., V23-08]|uniref:Uncharacterized protein n=1 Tax=Amycolatopsis heterodermiae TaxID=3110235 RepID=A0ABU5RP78_9PSEU|nr:hypothetical protein [Amycolatopsis sp., V23-08]MEA5367419.1 hypothetical protein [Amycolatopsis sp., V23-08]
MTGATPDGEPATERSVKALADLARAGYSSLRQPLTEVEFEVHHVIDRPGYLFELVVGEENQQPPKARFFLETLSSSANGAGLVVGTRTDGPPKNLRIRDHGSSEEPGLHFEQTDDRFVFRGTARPNLTFLAESDRRFEGIIAIADEPGPVKLAHGLLIKHLIGMVSRIAVEVAEAPLLSVQCPVQLPVEGDAEYRESQIPRSSSPAVRFSIALQRPSVALNLRLADELIQYCDDRGFRLWLADTRQGYRTGNWFSVRAHRPKDKDPVALPESGPDDRIETILPVTFVGPARVGSTHALVSMLERFPGVGIVGSSITLLDDLAFIHLQLGLTVKVEADDVPLCYSTGQDPRTALVEALKGHAEVPNGAVTGESFWDRVGDYQTLVGPAQPAVPVLQNRRLALWVSWQMERTDRGIATAVRALWTAFNRLGFGVPDAAGAVLDLPNLEYLICRDLGNSLLRGKGKFSVPLADVFRKFRGGTLETGPSKFCVGLEDAWKGALDGEPDAAGVREVTVVWREYWLGHWAATSV